MYKLYKLKQQGTFCGVCAGLADKYNINLSYLRVITLILCLFDGIGLVIYLLLALLLPDKSEIND